MKNEVNYLHEDLGKNYNSALTAGFQIQRHWFDYKLPKWFSCFNELQKYVCELYHLKPGNYSIFLAMLEMIICHHVQVYLWNSICLKQL